MWWEWVAIEPYGAHRQQAALAGHLQRLDGDLGHLLRPAHDRASEPNIDRGRTGSQKLEQPARWLPGRVQVQEPIPGDVAVARPVLAGRHHLRAEPIENRGPVLFRTVERPAAERRQVRVAFSHLPVQEPAALPEHLRGQPVAEAPVGNAEGQVGKDNCGKVAGRGKNRKELRRDIGNALLAGQFVSGVGQQKRVHQEIRIPAYLLQDRKQLGPQWERVLRHDRDGAQRVAPGLLHKIRHQLVRIPGQRRKVQGLNAG